MRMPQELDPFCFAAFAVAVAFLGAALVLCAGMFVFLAAVAGRDPGREPADRGCWPWVWWRSSSGCARPHSRSPGGSKFGQQTRVVEIETRRAERWIASARLAGGRAY
jgi:hypothetical protein